MISKAFRHVKRHGFSPKKRKDRSEGDRIDPLDEVDGQGLVGKKENAQSPGSGEGVDLEAEVEDVQKDDVIGETKGVYSGSSGDGDGSGNIAGDGRQYPPIFPVAMTVENKQKTVQEDKEISSEDGSEETEEQSNVEYECIKILDDGVSKAGYLKKRGRGRKVLTGAFLKPWSTRYVVVNSVLGILKYYGSEMDYQKQRLPRGQLYISGAKLNYTLPLQPSSSSSSYEFTITVTKTTGEVETLQMAATNERMTRQWVEIFAAICENEDSGITNSTIEATNDNVNSNKRQVSVGCNKCNFKETLTVQTSSSYIQYCCSSCGSFQTFETTCAEKGEEVDDGLRSDHIERNRLDTGESFDMSAVDQVSVKSRDSEFLSLTQMMMMKKDELINEVKKHSKGRRTRLFSVCLSTYYFLSHL